jgi:hypothetical protein
LRGQIRPKRRPSDAIAGFPGSSAGPYSDVLTAGRYLRWTSRPPLTGRWSGWEGHWRGIGN